MLQSANFLIQVMHFHKLFSLAYVMQKSWKNETYFDTRVVSESETSSK